MPFLSVFCTVCIFRGNGRRGHKRTIRPLRQEIVKEADALLQDIEMLFQKIFVPGIQVMFPYMCSQPGFSHNPEGGGNT